VNFALVLNLLRLFEVSPVHFCVFIFSRVIKLRNSMHENTINQVDVFAVTQFRFSLL